MSALGTTHTMDGCQYDCWTRLSPTCFAVALNTTRGLKAKRLYKTLLIFSWGMPAYVSILKVWRVGMFNTEFGLLTKLLVAFGMEKWISCPEM